LASHASDDGFHEIQLNGKQLVFLFMAATVVSVVIFLCGVLVGRGVRAERGLAAETAALGDVPVADAVSASNTPMPAGSDPRVAAPPPAVDDLSYFNRLEKPQPPAEALKNVPSTAVEAAPPAGTAPPPAAEPPAAREPQGSTASTRPAPAPAQEAAPAPAKPGYAVQLAALNSRSEADAMAKQLSSKGFAAYVLAPARGAPAIYRVRVGNFNTRREAETVATKLEKEVQFKPWVAPL
jgi:cell division septation protein DedD